MNNIKTGGPAFPTMTQDIDCDGHAYSYMVGGITMRDYFAARAMHGMLANIDLYHASISVAAQDGKLPAESISESAYEIADAMIAARGE